MITSNISNNKKKKCASKLSLNKSGIKLQILAKLFRGSGGIAVVPVVVESKSPLHHKSNEKQAPGMEVKSQPPYFCDVPQGAFMIDPHQGKKLLILSVWVARQTDVLASLSGVSEMPL